MSLSPSESFILGLISTLAVGGACALALDSLHEAVEANSLDLSDTVRRLGHLNLVLPLVLIYLVVAVAALAKFRTKLSVGGALGGLSAAGLVILVVRWMFTGLLHT